LFDTLGGVVSMLSSLHRGRLFVHRLTHHLDHHFHQHWGYLVLISYQGGKLYQLRSALLHLCLISRHPLSIQHRQPLFTGIPFAFVLHVLGAFWESKTLMNYLQPRLIKIIY